MASFPGSPCYGLVPRLSPLWPRSKALPSMVLFPGSPHYGPVPRLSLLWPRSQALPTMAPFQGSPFYGLVPRLSPLWPHSQALPTIAPFPGSPHYGPVPRLSPLWSRSQALPLLRGESLGTKLWIMYHKSCDSHSIKIEVYSNGKTYRLLKLVLRLQMCRYITNYYSMDGVTPTLMACDAMNILELLTYTIYYDSSVLLSVMGNEYTCTMERDVVGNNNQCKGYLVDRRLMNDTSYFIISHTR